MKCEFTKVFRSGKFEFDRPTNEDLKFRVTSVGAKNEMNYEESTSLREAIELHLESMESKLESENTKFSVRVTTTENEYIADTEVKAKNFRNRDCMDVPRTTRKLYEKFSDVVPCMKRPLC